MGRKLNRRAFATGTAALASLRFAPAIAEAAPFLIGLLTVKTGPLAQGGIQMEQGIAAFLKENGNTLAGRKIDDRTALAEGLHRISLTDTPRGPVKFDHLGNVVGDVFIRKCERRNGQLVNAVIKRYPDVSQFWTYDEKAFLANPVYARDYPPAKNLEP
jgi:hypothetical protein